MSYPPETPFLTQWFTKEENKNWFIVISECSFIPGLNICLLLRAIPCSHVSTCSVSFFVVGIFFVTLSALIKALYSSCHSCHSGTEGVAQVVERSISMHRPQVRAIAPHEVEYGGAGLESQCSGGGSKRIRSSRSVSATVGCLRPVWDTGDIVSKKRGVLGRWLSRWGACYQACKLELIPLAHIVEGENQLNTYLFSDIHPHVCCATMYASLHSINNFLILIYFNLFSFYMPNLFPTQQINFKKINFKKF